MTLDQILGAAYLKIVFSDDVPKVAPDTYDQDWIYQKWGEFLEQRGITKKKKKGYTKAFPDSPGRFFLLPGPLYIPPELAQKMLVLGYLP